MSPLYRVPASPSNLRVRSELAAVKELLSFLSSHLSALEDWNSRPGSSKRRADDTSEPPSSRPPFKRIRTTVVESDEEVIMEDSPRRSVGFTEMAEEDIVVL